MRINYHPTEKLNAEIGKEGISMNYHAKRKLTRSSMYITLALAICTVMCLTIVSFVGAHRSKKQTLTPNDQTASDNSSSNASSDSQNSTNSNQQNNNSQSTSQNTPNTDTLKPDNSDNQTNTTPDTEKEPDTPTGSEGAPDYVLPAEGYVLKSFSIDLPVWSLTMEDYRAHTGIDISAACGSAVYAMTGGVITDISEDPLMGMSMTVIHHDGNTALYQNLANEFPTGIEKGATVEAGQIIASVGDTALIEQCETDHLHVEIFTSVGERINPETLLDFSSAPTADSGNE